MKTPSHRQIVGNGVLLARPFLRVSPVATGSEQGLLGLAFAPDYATSGRFYVHYNDAAGTTRLARYTVSAADPDSANPAGVVIYSVLQPFANHNGGWIAFGPDGYLWMALGNGGSANDPGAGPRTSTSRTARSCVSTGAGRATRSRPRTTRSPAPSRDSMKSGASGSATPGGAASIA